MKIRTIIIKLSTEITQNEIPMFRGAINAALEENHSVLFHNHTEDGLRFAYPLIQYKRINGRAAIVCLGEGSSAVSEFFEKDSLSLQIGRRHVVCEVDEVVAKSYDISITDNLKTFRIRKWLPFNSDNYEAYKNANGIVEKCQILERIMTGNILSLAKGLGIEIESQLNVKIEDVIDCGTTTFKGVKMMSFDMDFLTNFNIPDFLGVGKGVSHGFGVVTNRIK